MAQQKKNVLFVMADDFNYWTGAQGYYPKAHTPHIDSLVAKGILFTDAHPASTGNIFRNIYIQGQLIRFISINGKYDGSASLSLKNTLLENITVEKKPTSYSWIYTGNAPDEVSLRFNNVMLSSKSITKDEFHTEGNVLVTFDPVLIQNHLNQPGISNHRIFALPVYHNTATSCFTINASSFTGPTRLKIVTVLGRVLLDDIYNPGVITVNASNLAPGIYKGILSEETGNDE